MSEAITKMHPGYNPFSIALRRKDKDIVCALIKKVSQNALCQASKVANIGLHLIEYFIKEYEENVLGLFIEHLDVETMDFFMLMPPPGTIMKVLHILIGNTKSQKNESIICKLVAHTSPETLFVISKQSLLHPQQMNLLSHLITNHASPKIIDAIFSRLNKEDLKHLFLNCESICGISPLLVAAQNRRPFLDFAPTDLTKETNPTMHAMIKYLDKDILLAGINDNYKNYYKHFKEIAPANKEMHDRLIARSPFFHSCANNPPALNELVEKMLLENEPLGFR